jgi:hypothetical protein
MHSQWNEVLPAAIESLPRLDVEIVVYVMNLPGKRRPAYIHAMKSWGLCREEFDRELAAAFDGIRLHLWQRHGIKAPTDLESA